MRLRNLHLLIALLFLPGLNEARAESRSLIPSSLPTIGSPAKPASQQNTVPCDQVRDRYDNVATQIRFLKEAISGLPKDGRNAVVLQTYETRLRELSEEATKLRERAKECGVDLNAPKKPEQPPVPPQTCADLPANHQEVLAQLEKQRMETRDKMRDFRLSDGERQVWIERHRQVQERIAALRALIDKCKKPEQPPVPPTPPATPVVPCEQVKAKYDAVMAQIGSLEKELENQRRNSRGRARSRNADTDSVIQERLEVLRAQAAHLRQRAQECGVDLTPKPPVPPATPTDPAVPCEQVKQRYDAVLERIQKVEEAMNGVMSIRGYADPNLVDALKKLNEEKAKLEQRAKECGVDLAPKKPEQPPVPPQTCADLPANHQEVLAQLEKQRMETRDKMRDFRLSDGERQVWIERHRQVQERIAALRALIDKCKKPEQPPVPPTPPATPVVPCEQVKAKYDAVMAQIGSLEKELENQSRNSRGRARSRNADTDSVIQERLEVLRAQAAHLRQRAQECGVDLTPKPPVPPTPPTTPVVPCEQVKQRYDAVISMAREIEKQIHAAAEEQRRDPQSITQRHPSIADLEKQLQELSDEASALRSRSQGCGVDLNPKPPVPPTPPTTPVVPCEQVKAQYDAVMAQIGNLEKELENQSRNPRGRARSRNADTDSVIQERLEVLRIQADALRTRAQECGVDLSPKPPVPPTPPTPPVTPVDPGVPCEQVKAKYDAVMAQIGNLEKELENQRRNSRGRARSRNADTDSMIQERLEILREHAAALRARAQECGVDLNPKPPVPPTPPTPPTPPAPPTPPVQPPAECLDLQSHYQIVLRELQDVKAQLSGVQRGGDPNNRALDSHLAERLAQLTQEEASLRARSANCGTNPQLPVRPPSSPAPVPCEEGGQHMEKLEERVRHLKVKAHFENSPDAKRELAHAQAEMESLITRQGQCGQKITPPECPTDFGQACTPNRPNQPITQSPRSPECIDIDVRIREVEEELKTIASRVHAGRYDATDKAYFDSRVRQLRQTLTMLRDAKANGCKIKEQKPTEFEVKTQSSCGPSGCTDDLSRADRANSNNLMTCVNEAAQADKKLSEYRDKIKELRERIRTLASREANKRARAARELREAENKKDKLREQALERAKDARSDARSLARQRRELEREVEKILAIKITVGCEPSDNLISRKEQGLSAASIEKFKKKKTVRQALQERGWL